MARYLAITTFSVMMTLSMSTFAKAQSDNSLICQATIAAIFNKSIDEVKIQSEKSEITHVTYVRLSDASVWANKCKISGNRVIWATENGRWRDSDFDEIVTYEKINSEIKIRQAFSDGSSVEDSFYAE
jgi:hypothetical protein|tara:strand:- start:75 stop:458 length:384 start_codon:yes stop_codon:yes gene_type:complete